MLATWNIKTAPGPDALTVNGPLAVVGTRGGVKAELNLGKLESDRAFNGLPRRLTDPTP